MLGNKPVTSSLPDFRKVQSRSVPIVVLALRLATELVAEQLMTTVSPLERIAAEVFLLAVTWSEIPWATTPATEIVLAMGVIDAAMAVMYVYVMFISVTCCSRINGENSCKRVTVFIAIFDVVVLFSLARDY